MGVGRSGRAVGWYERGAAALASKPYSAGHVKCSKRRSGVTEREEHRGVATYRDVIACVERQHGFTPKTCWIAHCKELSGVRVRRAWNRLGNLREEPCPPRKRAAIIACMVEVGMLNRGDA